jgi:hypothetical protein
MRLASSPLFPDLLETPPGTAKDQDELTLLMETLAKDFAGMPMTEEEQRD